jgi:6,7-dimethyl-8-ribityllumazine synthase
MNQSYRETIQTSESQTRGGERVAFVQSCWHKDIVDRCREGFVPELAGLGVPKDRIDFFEVPGAFEIPLQAKLLAKTGRYAAIVAAGFVVDGGIYRHEFVADAVIAALMRVQLDTEVPVISAVLTPQRFHEHTEHRNFFLDHFVVKGAEAARACARTMENMRFLGRAYARTAD